MSIIRRIDSYFSRFTPKADPEDLRHTAEYRAGGDQMSVVRAQQIQTGRAIGFGR